MTLAKLLIRASLGAAMAAAISTSALAQGSFPGSSAQPVSRGATGRTSLTQNALIFGNGTAPVGFIVPGTAGKCLVDNGTIWNPGYCVTASGSPVSSGGVSVLNPGTGTLEAVLPIQTVTGASKSFATADLFKETRRSNSGSAMTDTFPASSATGLVNGTKIVVTNVDATASDTISPGAGTTIGGSGVVGPGRAIQYVYDLANTTWRPSLNTGTALLGPNNLSDVSSASTARTNLGLAIGSNVQAWDTDLDCLAALSATGVLKRTGGGTCSAGTVALADLASISAGVIGSVAGGTPAVLTSAQITAMINLATASLSGAIPAWPNNTTTFFRGDGSYATLNFAAIGGVATGAQLPTPGASSLGAVFSKSCAAGGQFIQTINTDGTVNCVTPAGGGNVSTVGTPVANQIAQWTGSTSIQGVNLASLLTAGTGINITGTTSPTIAAIGGSLVAIQTFCASGCTTTIANGSTGTYTRSANVTRAIVRIIGTGGGGGGGATTSSTQVAAAGGGGGGGFCQKNIGSVGTGLTVTMGAVGAGASAGNNAGGTGGTTSFDTGGGNYRATGGTGGNGSSAAVSVETAGSGGGIGVGCDISLQGAAGGAGFGQFPTGFFPFAIGGFGGMGANGGGGGVGSPANANGSAGNIFGGGGSGGALVNSAGPASGGAGAGGIVIVEEYTQ